MDMGHLSIHLSIYISLHIGPSINLSIYSVIIANCHQKNGFFEHLHSSEISEQYLIFFVLVGHLIIPMTLGWKLFQHAFTTTWIWSVIFRKTHHTRHILNLFIIQMLITPKVFGLEKRNCTFWKWQSFSFKMVCVSYISDKNYGFYRPKCIIFSLRKVCFGLKIRCIRDAHHFKAEALPFPKRTVTFF